MKRYLSAALALTLCVGLTVPASATGQTFIDVPQSHWAYEAVDYAVDKSYFSGTGGGAFSPDGTMTNAMLWTVLARMDGTNTTVANGQSWYQSSQDWAVKNGISDGTNPNSNTTREQFATMLYNFAAHIGAPTTKDFEQLYVFSDEGSTAAYAREAMAWAVTYGIMSGTSTTTISPKGLVTRAQAAVMLMRFDQMVESGTPGVDEFARMKQEIVQLINEARSREGLGPLEMSDKLMQAAQIRANECTVQFSHTRPDGTSFNTVFSEVGFNGHTDGNATPDSGGEILAKGFSTAQLAVSGWLMSPGHRDIIMSTGGRYIGIGVADGSDRVYTAIISDISG